MGLGNNGSDSPVSRTGRRCGSPSPVRVRSRSTCRGGCRISNSAGRCRPSASSTRVLRRTGRRGGQGPSGRSSIRWPARRPSRSMINAGLRSTSDHNPAL